jgi:hypothetical protein
MLHVSRYEPDPTRFGEFLACLWQGEVPADLRIRSWIYLAGPQQRMMLVWEAEEEGAAWVERAFASFGRFETEASAQDATDGMQLALDRDLDGFATWLRDRNRPETEIERAVDVRRRGMEAPDFDAAAAAGRAWTNEAPTA